MKDLRNIRIKIQRLVCDQRFKTAINLIEESLSRFPTEGFLYTALGDLHLKIRNFKRAMLEYERAILLYWGQGYYPNAVMLCRKILRIDPAHADAYRMLSRIQGDLGQHLPAARNRVRFLLKNTCDKAEIHRHLSDIESHIIKAEMEEK